MSDNATPKLKPCPFCGGAVKIDTECPTSPSINCCVQVGWQVCDVLEEESVRWDDEYRWCELTNSYPQKSIDLTALRLAEMWNTRAL